MTESALPITTVEEKPLVTFALFAYNQEKYIREAVEAAFAQTYSPLQIILSDDCSPDSTFEIMKQMAAEYKGAHEIVLNKNERNIGIGLHVNKMIALAKGDYIIAAAGDDISVPKRTEILAEYFEKNNGCYSVFSNVVVIDDAGLEHGTWLEDNWILPKKSLIQICSEGQYVVGCSHAWRKDVFDIFGPIDSRVIREDNAIPFRSALLGNVDYLEAKLVKYRRHGNNIHQTFDEIFSHSDHKKKRMNHANGMVGVRATMLNDFDTYLAFSKKDRVHFNQEFCALKKGLSLAQLEYDLFLTMTVWQLMRLAIGGCTSKQGVKIVVRFLLRENFPRVFRWLVRLRGKL